MPRRDFRAKGSGEQKRLFRRQSAVQSKALYALCVQVEFASDEPVLPRARQLDALTQQLDCAGGVSAAQKDNSAD